MKVIVRGIGWLTKEGYGCVRNGFRHAFEAGEGAHSLVKKNIFSHPFKNFGRLDPVSKMTAYALSLALRDAGIDYGPQQKKDIGIIATNAEGCLHADVAYFRDYVDGGRTLSRGNLFIYTLPSSAAGEAAIHFGLRGPLLYVAARDNALLQVIDTASQMVVGSEAPAIAAGKANDDEALFFVIGTDAEQSSTALCSISDAVSAAKATVDVSEIVRKFADLRRR